jgi:hypothetical protein
MEMRECYRHDTLLPADSVELVNDNILAVGTYYYDPVEKGRSGNVQFLSWDPHHLQLHPLSTYSTHPSVGILDSTWSMTGQECSHDNAAAVNNGDRTVGFLAASDGSIIAGQFDRCTGSFSLLHRHGNGHEQRQYPFATTLL